MEQVTYPLLTDDTGQITKNLVSWARPQKADLGWKAGEKRNTDFLQDCFHSRLLCDLEAGSVKLNCLGSKPCPISSYVILGIKNP